MESDKQVVSGKRKRCVARAVIYPGIGKVIINRKSYESLSRIKKLMIEEPLRIAESVIGKLNYNIDVKIIGGGIEAGIEAARLAIARALVKISKSKELAKQFIEYDRNLLVADTRRKEAYKPGDSKARSARQSSKR